MIRLALILGATAVVLHAQSPLLQRGAGIFRTTCAVAYCHGSDGTAGRAPQLAGRAFNANVLFDVILLGKTGTGMPGFSQQLNSSEIEAVTQYVLSLSGPAGVGALASKTGNEPAPAVQQGRTLFFDATRMGGCGRCHELNDRGSPIGPDLRTVDPAKFHDTRAASRTRTVTASPVGEAPFPALVTEQTAERIRVYDLSAALPVMRSFRPAEVRITPGNEWSHASAVETYSETELEAISGYLTWVVRTAPAK